MKLKAKVAFLTAVSAITIVSHRRNGSDSIITGAGDRTIRVVRAVAPEHPLHIENGGVAVVEVQVDDRSKRTGTTLHYGDAPFSVSALNSLIQWRYSLPEQTNADRLGVTFLFRPRSVRPMDLSNVPGILSTTGDHAAFPSRISDPGYPSAQTGDGVVILQLTIDSNGKVDQTSVLLDSSAFSELAKSAVEKWQFIPAQKNGQATVGCAVVVISFVDPNAWD